MIIDHLNLLGHANVGSRIRNYAYIGQFTDVRFFEVMRVEREIIAFIQQNERDEERLNELMIQLFQRQFKENIPYQKFCRQKGKTLRNVKKWDQIPFVPVDAFKHLTLSRKPVEETAACFMTSGSTSGKRGKHYHAHLDVYNASMDETVRQFVLQGSDKWRIGVIFPSRESMPNSSLAHYLNWIYEHYGDASSGYFIDETGIQYDAFAEFLQRAQKDQVPVLLLGASYSYVHVFEQFQDAMYPLPEGSRIFDTGGYKNQSEALDLNTFYERLATMFDVPRSSCLNMYGMSELSTQYYDRGNARVPSVKIGPPWMKTRIIDPLTEEDVPFGETGIIVHYDLANVNSVIAVMTEDVGYETEEGFILLGRAEGAEAKGCSVQLSDFLQAVQDV